MPWQPSADHVVEVPPVEVAVPAVSTGEVAGHHARLVVDAAGVAVGLVGEVHVVVERVEPGQVAGAADHPRRDHVERVVHVEEARPRVVDAGAPVGRHAADDVAALGLEPVDDVQAGVGGERAAGVVEAEAPDADDRLAVLPGVGRRRRVRRHLGRPVGLDLRLHVGPVGDVVHDVELAPERLGRLRTLAAIASRVGPSPPVGLKRCSAAVSQP